VSVVVALAVSVAQVTPHGNATAEDPAAVGIPVGVTDGQGIPCANTPECCIRIQHTSAIDLKKDFFIYRKVIFLSKTKIDKRLTII
jgi:uncharacterized protein (DUF1499 family)